MLNITLAIVVSYHTAESIGEIYMTVSIIFRKLWGRDIIEKDMAKIKKT